MRSTAILQRQLSSFDDGRQLVYIGIHRHRINEKRFSSKAAFLITLIDNNYQYQ